jgi:hypothetical protein
MYYATIAVRGPRYLEKMNVSHEKFDPGPPIFGPVSSQLGLGLAAFLQSWSKIYIWT